MTTLPRWANLAIGFMLVLLVGGPAWNLAASQWTHQNNPVPGALSVVNGHQMHIHCTGSGSPTVVLEAAADVRQQYWRRHAFREELTRAFASLGLAPLG